MSDQPGLLGFGPLASGATVTGGGLTYEDAITETRSSSDASASTGVLASTMVEGAPEEQKLLWGVDELYWDVDALYWPLRSDVPASTGIFGSSLVESLEAGLLWGADELYWGDNALYWTRIVDAPASTGSFGCLLGDILIITDVSVGTRNVFDNIVDVLNIAEINTVAFGQRVNYPDPEVMCVRYEPRSLRINAEQLAAAFGENRSTAALPDSTGDAEPRKRTC